MTGRPVCPDDKGPDCFAAKSRTLAFRDWNVFSELPMKA